MNTKIFEDNILSRNDIAVRYVFQKMFSPQGTLVAVECLSRFDNLSISPEDFFRHATAAVRERIFLEQLALIEKHRHGLLIMASPPQSMSTIIFLAFCISRKSKPTLTI
jgi:hypothetical protein